MLENKPKQIHNIEPGLSILWDMAVHSKATNKLTHISGKMLLKGPQSLLVCLKKVSSLISKSSLCPIRKGHTVKFHQYAVSLWKTSNGICQNGYQKIPVCKIHALAFKFTILMHPQKKKNYLSSILPESPCWNLSCVTKHLCSYPKNRGKQCAYKRETSTPTFWFRAPQQHSGFLSVDNNSPPTSFTHKLHTHSTAKGTCKLLCCWTAFHKEAIPEDYGYCPAQDVTLLQATHVIEVAEKSLEGIAGGPLVSVPTTQCMSNLTYAVCEVFVACF